METLSTNSPAKVWRQDFEVHSYEIGPSQLVTPQAICRFLQEAAGNHATQLGVSAEELSRQGQMWVLSRLTLDMVRYPRWHDTLTLETWPVDKPSSIRGHRDFLLRDSSNEVIGQASTVWLLLDQQNLKPLRIPSWLSEHVSAGIKPEINQPLYLSMFSGAPRSGQEFTVRASDIDYNMHVNNVCYLDWALEAIQPDFRLQNTITHLDVAYRAEGKYGMTILSECWLSDEASQTYLHQIKEKSTSQLLALLRTQWTSNASR